MRRWFIPSWCGDFRLEADGDNCVLTVVDPLPAELAQLGEFLVKARKKGWVDNYIGVAAEGKTVVEVKAPVDRAGKVLLGRSKPRKGILTVVKSVNGELTAVQGDGEELVVATSSPAAAEAATVRRPTLCCPHCIKGPDIRASEVLQAFSTTEQWRSWINLGYLYAYGQLSGRKYLVAHRHHPIAIQNKYIVWDCTSGHIVHCWDWSVPPPEEVLMCKLVIEHAEPWVRNKSTILDAVRKGLAAEDVYHNPFMAENRQHLDGLASTYLSEVVGKSLGNVFSSIAKMFKGNHQPKSRPRFPLRFPTEAELETRWNEDGSWTSNIDYDGSILPFGVRRKERYEA